MNDNVWLPLSTVPVPGDWVLDAECRGLDPGLFVQERGEHGSDHAKEVCRRCSVITDCLEYALPHPRLQGIFGGLSGRDRRLLRKSRLKEAS